MDRAESYHHGRASDLAVQNPVQSLAMACDSRRGRRIRRLLFDHLFGGAQLPEATDAQIVGKGFHGGGSCWARRRYKKNRQEGWRFLWMRSEEHTSELQSLMRISYAVFCLKKKKAKTTKQRKQHTQIKTTTRKYSKHNTR